jgi:soluble lytic murein transglycosylase-like protein
VPEPKTQEPQPLPQPTKADPEIDAGVGEEPLADTSLLTAEEPGTDSTSSAELQASNRPVFSTAKIPQVDSTSLTTSDSTGDTVLGSGGGTALQKFKQAIEAAAREAGVPANVLGGMVWTESRADPNVQYGLMQIDPNTITGLQTDFPVLQGKDINDPATNILAGALRLKQMIDKFGSVEAGLRGYNSGENGVDTNNLNSTPSGTGDPNYITKVMGFAATIASGGDLPP